MAACSKPRQRVVAPWGEEVGASATVANDEAFDLEAIEASGELIALTLSGPETYYDYHGRALGIHAMLCQQLADSLGVRLRMELCRDTAELLSRLAAGDADMVAFPLSQADSTGPGWKVADGKPMLSETLQRWYSPQRMELARAEEHRLLTTGRVKRKVFAPMLNKQGGIISRYDALFQRYCQPIHWDWRLMAAQCYQESTFDPHAHSWAGACGLMQIMPSTADHLGLSRSDLYNPEQNIAAAARYLAELERGFSDIHDRRERQNFVLAAYNGGPHHIRDAMALARRDGRNPSSWDQVSVYVLRLSQPEYYNAPEVKNGYMRGSETVDYVQQIRQRHGGYRGVRAASSVSSSPQKSRNERHRSKYKI
jgi:membrane-bound lytic murein transglycosylase F